MRYGSGVYQQKEFSGAVLEQEHDSEALDAAAGGSGRGSDEHTQKQNCLGHGRPCLVICRGKSCSCQNRHHLKGSVPDGLTHGVIDFSIDVPAYQQRQK